MLSICLIPPAKLGFSLGSALGGAIVQTLGWTWVYKVAQINHDRVRERC